MTCGEVKARVQAKIANVERKIEDLGQMRVALSKLSVKCTGRGPVGKCPILEELDTLKNYNRNF